MTSKESCRRSALGFQLLLLEALLQRWGFSGRALNRLRKLKALQPTP